MAIRRTVDILKQVGLEHKAAKRYSEAVTSLNEAVTLSPDDPEIWFGLAFSLGELQRHEEAVTVYRQGIKIESRLAWTWSSTTALPRLKF